MGHEYEQSYIIHLSDNCLDETHHCIQRIYVNKKRGGTQWEAFRSLKGSPVIVRAQFTPPGIESGHVPTQVLINRSN